MVTRPNCKLCTTPHRSEAEQLFRASGERRAVHRWLESRGADISYNAVKNHFARHLSSAPEESDDADVSLPGLSLDSVTILEEMQRATLLQVRKLAAVTTDERNIAPISSAFFRGVQLVGQQVDLKARLLGYYNPVDEPTKLQFQGAMNTLRATLSKATAEQRTILAPVIRELELLTQQSEEG
jgi:hypothetical protein